MGCCECKFHALSPTLPLDHMLLARGPSLLSTQQTSIIETKAGLTHEPFNASHF